MDPQRQRIRDDLRGVVRGDVLCDDIATALYASDGSLFQVRPLAVIRPRSTDDVSAVLRYANDQALPVHARAGTGLAGESLGSGLLIDFSRYMRRVLETRDDTVRVQPGVVHARLNEHLRPRGRVFGPDPAMSQVTTMGSVIAIDNSGSHWPMYGSARSQTLSLEIVLADGTVMEVGREALRRAVEDDPAARRRADLAAGVAALCVEHRELILEKKPRTLVNRSGYDLATTYDGDSLDMAKLICGSEGTLAMITAATVAIQPLPRYKVAAILMFASLEKAVQAVPLLSATKPCALDMLDRRHLSLAIEHDPRFEPLVSRETESLLLIEFAGDNLREEQDRIRAAVDEVTKNHRLAFDARIASDMDELRLFWRLARRVTPTLQRAGGSARPVPFVEDVAIPPEMLGDFLGRLQRVLKTYQVTASFYGHVGHGQLHIRPFLDLNSPTDTAKLDALAAISMTKSWPSAERSAASMAMGSVGRRSYAASMARLCDVFAQVKRLFDPQGILNPGKILAEREEERVSLTAFLRPGAAQLSYLTQPSSTPQSTAEATPANGETLATPADEPTLYTPLLQWSTKEFLDEAVSCNGCGICRTQMPDQRMCPIFRIGPGEEASPRAKANLVRGLMTGELDPQLIGTPEFKETADLCVHCHQCRVECPAEVDIPKLMFEAKAAHVAINGLKVKQWFLADIDRISRWGSRFPGIANWVLGNRQMRWLLERFFGLAHNRKLPRLAKQSFLRWAAKRNLIRPRRRSEADPRKVLVFADTGINYYDSQLGRALVLVLEHNGATVYVPPEPLHAGMPFVTAGAVDRARALAAANVPLLAEAVRQGYTIVAAEPSSVMCLTREYPQLLDDEDARMVAANTVEASEYLWRLHQQGELQLDLSPVHANVGYHQPCHSRVLQNGTPAENLLRLIAGLQVVRLDRGCSGMAGTYGLSKENFRNSLRAGRGLIDALRDAPLQAGATECTACKMQMEQGASKPTLHPLKWLALSYGLMPELAESWQTHVPDHFIT